VDEEQVYLPREQQVNIRANQVRRREVPKDISLLRHPTRCR